jgi:biopolymer transport protein ExbB
MKSNCNAMFRCLIMSLMLVLCAASAWTQTPTNVSAPSASNVISPSVNSSKPNGAALADNPYGMAAVWAGSDGVAKAVLVILLIMSAGSWYIMAIKWLEQRKVVLQARAASQLTGSHVQLRNAAQALPAASPFIRIVAAGMDAVHKHAAVAAQISLDEWIARATDRAVERAQRRLQLGMAFLATVGSTAPFVGLFGTVWGIYHALTAIGVAGQASIDKVAGPVGEALIMTAIGLAVAVPAVLGYNWLSRRNKNAMDCLRDFSGEVHGTLLTAP